MAYYWFSFFLDICSVFQLHDTRNELPAKGAAATTFGSVMFYDSRADYTHPYSPDVSGDIAAMALHNHEYIHIMQYAGNPNQFSDYLSQCAHLPDGACGDPANKYVAIADRIRMDYELLHLRRAQRLTRGPLEDAETRGSEGNDEGGSVAFLADTRNRTAAKGTLRPPALLVVAATGVLGPEGSSTAGRSPLSISPRRRRPPGGRGSAAKVLPAACRGHRGCAGRYASQQAGLRACRSCRCRDAVRASARTPSDVGTTVTINADGSATC